MKLLYQILFEVKVLHEYFLTNPDNTSVFQDATQTDRLAWLNDRYTKDQPVLEDLGFGLAAATVEAFRNQGLILLNSFSGFQVAVQVTETIQGGTVTYAPIVPLAPDFNMVILMQQPEGQFGLLTNGRLQRPVPALYYFSNEQTGSPKTAPVLSNPVPARVAGYTYEQGELSAVGSAVTICYYTGTTPNFITVPGDGFVNESDRLIVPTEFEYSFLPSDQVTQATFTLKDAGGNPVRSVTAGGAGTLDMVTLNFTTDPGPTAPPLVMLPSAKASDPLVYTLEVSGNGGYTRSLSLIFYDNAAELLTTWGVIQIQTAVTNSGFNLLDANGNLVTPVLPAPDSTTSPYPVFEIRCKSCYTFWRYYSDDPSKTLKAPTGSLTSFIQGTGGILTTLAPVPATYLPYFFSTNPGATNPTFTYLPNPVSGTVIDVEGNQLYSNIWVPESGIFPVN